MLPTVERDAYLSICGAYRYWLTRRWDERPILVVVMFNPSTADHEVDDPTISLLSHIASHNGYGGITVVNACPLRSSDPALAAAMIRAGLDCDWWARDELMENQAAIRTAVGNASAVLLAWGNLGQVCPSWMDTILETINEALPAGARVYCLGRTAGGHPMHPMARGKHKLPKDAPLLPWS